MVKNPLASGGDGRDVGSVPTLGRSSGGRNGSPLQYSCLGGPMDKKRGLQRVRQDWVTEHILLIHKHLKEGWIQCKEELNVPCTLDISSGNICYSDAVCRCVFLLPHPNLETMGKHHSCPLRWHSYSSTLFSLGSSSIPGGNYFHRILMTCEIFFKAPAYITSA